MTTEISAKDKDYKSLLQELQSILAKGHAVAYKAVDNIKVQTYWQLGERIVREELNHEDRADYGKYLVENLSIDLSVEKRRLYEIVQFYRAYPIVRTVSAQLSWSHYLDLIEIEAEKERAFYERQAVLHSWSVRDLRRQIKNKLYENLPQKEVEAAFQANLPAVVEPEVFKGAYDFHFIESAEKPLEKQLEEGIIKHIEPFLKEFGEDFAFLGRQVPIKIDQETHNIDLVLYHRGIPCIVLVDLKVGKIDSRDIGQMNKYVEYYRRNKQYEHEKGAVGLIIGHSAGKEEIAYALGGLEEKIFVAIYKTKMPSDKKISKAVKKL